MPKPSLGFLFAMINNIETGRGIYEKAPLHKGENLVFTVNSLSPEGSCQYQPMAGEIESVDQGQFRGDVIKLSELPWVIKTALPTKSRYGIPLRLLRKAHERLHPFFPRHFEAEAQLEHVGQKILRLLVHGYFGETYYLPDSVGYTFIPGTGYCQVIEKIDGFRPPKTFEEINQIFQAQADLTEFCRQFGLVEPSAQIHQDNPLAPSNLVLIGGNGQKRVCWLDVHPGIKMRPSGYVVPTFYFPFHKKICQQTAKDGEPAPAFNKIHVSACREAITEENNQVRLIENLGEEGYQELQGWLSLYNALLEKHDWLVELPVKDQWAQAWRESGDVPESVVEKIEESEKLLLLARLFGIRPVMFLLDTQYRLWASHGLFISARREASWERFRKRQVKTLQEKERIGINNQLESNSSLILNTVGGRIMPAWMQRLTTDPQFRNLEEITRYFVLGGAKNTQKHGAITIEELEKLKKQVSLQSLSRKEMSVYLATFLTYQVIARGADFFEIGSYLSALALPEARLQRAALGFTGGWIAPVGLRLGATKFIELVSQVDMSTAMRWLVWPKIGHYLAIPDQLTATTVGNRKIRNLIIRSRVSTLFFLMPTWGLGSKFDFRLAKRLSREDKPQGEVYFDAKWKRKFYLAAGSSRYPYDFII